MPGPQAPDSCDIAVVGGGIVGLAVARELAVRRPRASVCVLEREPDLARHQSGHNSGVVHAGIYYAPGSLKAKLCVEGARDMYAFCERHAIPHERSGKVIVALEPHELPRLEELERRGQANGVPELRRVDGDRLRELEPHARGLAALHSPGSGIVDYRAVARALADELREGGGTVVTGCEVLDARADSRGVALAHAQGHTLARHAVFCVGAWADELIPKSEHEQLRILPFKGSYLRLSPERGELVRALIYPVPDPSLPFLGVHFTRTTDGEVLVGPTAIPALARNQDAPLTARLNGLRELVAWPGSRRMMARWWRAGAEELQHALVRSTLVRAAARYVPELTTDDVQPSFSGIRAQALARDGSLVDDFVFSYSQHAVYVRSAPSPGATSSLAIARHVADEAEARIGL
ncbi:MAG TPA: L-2-hydroxyglutarate oxidase [Solirubrobacteraceae bacterium]|nr:L-2-hydroxyglutarate oxidase [Solirubrobacteraceae bacterium]